MRGSVKIGRIAGIPIRVHWSFAFLLLLILYDTQGASGAAVGWTVAAIVALFVAVVIHELSHCFVARRLGLTVRDIVLLPLGGLSEIEGMPSSSSTELKVAIVGPLTSLVLGGVLVGVALLAGVSMWPPTLVAPLTGAHFLSWLAWINVFLAAFNLVPALPMDGGRVLRAAISSRRDPVRATNIATSIAYVLGGAMIAVGLAVDWFLILIGAFVVMGASAERRAATMRAAFRGVRVGDVMVHEPVPVQASLQIGQLAPWLSSYPGRAMPVADGQGGAAANQAVGIIAMRHLVGTTPWTTIGEVCDRDVPVIDAGASLVPDALEAFGVHRKPELLVSWQGQTVGVLYLSTVEGIITQLQQSPGAGRGGQRPFGRSGPGADAGGPGGAGGDPGAPPRAA